METLPLPLITFPTSVVPLPPRSPFPVTERGKFIKQFDGPEERDRGSYVSSFGNWFMRRAVLSSVPIVSCKRPPTSA